MDTQTSPHQQTTPGTAHLASAHVRTTMGTKTMLCGEKTHVPQWWYGGGGGGGGGGGELS